MSTQEQQDTIDGLTPRQIKIIKEKTLEFFKVGLDIQMDTPLCVFIEMSGHVNNGSIDIRESKDRYDVEVKKFGFRIPTFDNFPEWENGMDVKIEELKGYLDFEKIEKFKVAYRADIVNIDKTFDSTEEAETYVSNIRQDFPTIPNLEIETISTYQRG